MPLFGSLDQANNSPIYTPAQVGKTANAANRDTLYGNTSVGVFAIDANEIKNANASIITIDVIKPGSGYAANAVVTISASQAGANAAANASSNSIGKISAINISNTGTGYTGAPVITIDPPAAKTFNANTAVAANGQISIATNVFQVGDKVTYQVAAGNTVLSGLSNNAVYSVAQANATVIYLASPVDGKIITLTKGASETGHSFVGERATAVATMTGAKNAGVAHTGWNLRTVGTGGRAGRVQYECLVAGAIGSDGSDDTILPDA